MFSAKSDRIADAVRLLAAAGAMAADPSLLSALKSGPSAYDTLKKLAAAPPPSVTRLAYTLAAEARAHFEATRDLPADADLLYVQMVEIGMVAAPEIVAAGMEAEAVAEAMAARLTDPEHRSGPMLGLFRALTVPVLTRLLADNAFAADLTPAFMARMLGGIADVSAKLDDIAGQSRDTLEALALRFGEPEPERMALPELRGLLVAKAKDYRRLEAQVRAIGDREGRIANLKAAAEDAIRGLRLDEAKALIRDAIAVQRSERTLQALREDAELVQAEAGIALLENDADEAHRLLSGVTDAFAAFDQNEAFWRRRAYLHSLLWHGETYGGSGLACAVEIGRRNAAAANEAASPSQLSTAQDDLGIALLAEGVRVGGPAGAVLLGESVDAHREALRGLSEWADPAIWAGIQSNLGNALQAQGKRVGGIPGAALLGVAVEAYHAALQVWTVWEHPTDWASTQNNLGGALGLQGQRAGDAALLGEAVKAYRAALRVRTEATHPVDWAATQHNLGTALRAQGRQIDGPVGTALLDGAVEAFRAALRVRTEVAHPVDWAKTLNSLGNALSNQGERVGGEAGAALLGEAADAYRAALRVQTEATHPVDWARTTENLGLAHAAVAGNRACPDPEAALAEAARCLEAALRVYNPEHMPYYHKKISESLARVRAKLAARGGDPA